MKKKFKFLLILAIIFLSVIVFFFKIRNDHLYFIAEFDKLKEICKNSGDKTNCEYSIISSISTKEQAYWACLSFFTSFIGLVGIVISLIYTAKANFLAQESLKQSAENSLIEQRPWIDIKIALNPNKNLEINNEKELISIYPIILIKNIGLTAAEVISQEIFLVNGIFNTYDWVNDKVEYIRKNPKNNKKGQIYLPQDGISTSYPIHKEKSDFNKYVQGSENGIAPSIAIIVTYKSIYNDEKVFHSAKLVLVSKIDGKPLTLKDIPINNSNLMIYNMVSNIQ